MICRLIILPVFGTIRIFSPNFSIAPIELKGKQGKTCPQDTLNKKIHIKSLFIFKEKCFRLILTTLFTYIPAAELSRFYKIFKIRYMYSNLDERFNFVELYSLLKAHQNILHQSHAVHHALQAHRNHHRNLHASISPQIRHRLFRTYLVQPSLILFLHTNCTLPRSQLLLHARQCRKCTRLHLDFRNMDYHILDDYPDDVSLWRLVE